jgi:hypothetical protein
MQSYFLPILPSTPIKSVAREGFKPYTLKKHSHNHPDYWMKKIEYNIISADRNSGYGLGCINGMIA